jgi:hypothetical protein
MSAETAEEMCARHAKETEAMRAGFEVDRIEGTKLLEELRQAFLQDYTTPRAPKKAATVLPFKSRQP